MIEVSWSSYRTTRAPRVHFRDPFNAGRTVCGRKIPHPVYQLPAQPEQPRCSDCVGQTHNQGRR